jgi:hypothetical protein
MDSKNPSMKAPKKVSKKKGGKLELADPEAMTKNKKDVQAAKKKLAKLADEFEARFPDEL